MGQKDEGKRGAYKRGLQALCYRDRPRDFCGNILSGKSRQVEGNTNRVIEGEKHKRTSSYKVKNKMLLNFYTNLCRNIASTLS